MIHIILPYPDPRLSPNKRSDRRWLTKVRQQQRDAGYYAAYPFRGRLSDRELLHATITFYPPDKQRRDWTNLAAAYKALEDGVAAGLGIDDSLFRPITIDIGPPDKANPRTELLIND